MDDLNKIQSSSTDLDVALAKIFFLTFSMSAKTQSGWTFGFHFCQKMNFKWGIFRWHFCYERHHVGAITQKLSFCFQAFKNFNIPMPLGPTGLNI